MGSYPTRSRRRANGEGSIYQDRGRWRGAATWTGPDGKRRRRVVSGTTQAEVRGKLAELTAQVDKGMAPAGRRTVAEYLPAWLEASRQRIRPATWYKAEQVTRVHLIPAIGRVDLAKLTPGDVERLTADLVASGRSARTAQVARGVLRPKPRETGYGAFIDA